MAVAILREFEPTEDRGTRFESDRLMPAIQEFSGEDNAQPINQVTYDLHGVVTGR